VIEQPPDPDPKPPGQKDPPRIPHAPDPIEEPPPDSKPVPPPDIPPLAEPGIPTSLQHAWMDRLQRAKTAITE